MEIEINYEERSKAFMVVHISVFGLIINPLRGGPIPEILQYRANPWPGRSKPLFHGLGSKISLIYKRLGESRFRYYAEKNRYYT